MRKILILAAVGSCVSSFAEEDIDSKIDNSRGELIDLTKDTVKESAKDMPQLEELQPLGEPSSFVSGAYVGVGADLMMMSHSYKLAKWDMQDANKEKLEYQQNGKTSSTQFGGSIFVGFGGMFYEKFYAGIEVGLTHMLSGGSGESKSDQYKRLKNKATCGLNMDVRFGIMFPQQKIMPYITFGFSKVMGTLALDYDKNYIREPDNTVQGTPLPKSDIIKKDVRFGSYAPTVGLGVEYKISDNWGARLDMKYAITTKDTDRQSRYDYKTVYKYEAQPRRFNLKVCIVRSIH